MKKPILALLIGCLPAFLPGCSGGGSGKSSVAAPGVEPAAALERSSGVAASTLAAFSAWLSQNPADRLNELLLTGDGSGGSEEENPPIDGAGGATTSPCQTSGNLVRDCTVERDLSVFSAIFDNCLTFNDTRTGGFIASVPAPGACPHGQLPDHVPIHVVFNNYIWESADRHGIVILRTIANFTEDYLPSETDPGCNGKVPCEQTIHGAFSHFSDLNKVDFTLTARGLKLKLDPAAAGSDCGMRLVIDGDADIEDRQAGRVFTALFKNLAITTTPGEDNCIQATVAGSVQNQSCLGGEISLKTIEPILYCAGEPCPTGGQIEATLSNDQVSRFRFTASGGIDFDLDGDGVFEKSAPGCHEGQIDSCK